MHIVDEERARNELLFTEARFRQLAAPHPAAVVAAEQAAPAEGEWRQRLLRHQDELAQLHRDTQRRGEAGLYARASITEAREDLEAQVERDEITEGAYLQRMNALRDAYNRV